jgi:hypothetical protein
VCLFVYIYVRVYFNVVIFCMFVCIICLFILFVMYLIFFFFLYNFFI